MDSYKLLDTALLRVLQFVRGSFLPLLLPACIFWVLNMLLAVWADPLCFAIVGNVKLMLAEVALDNIPSVWLVCDQRVDWLLGYHFSCSLLYLDFALRF